MADKRAYFKLDVGYLTNPKVSSVLDDSPHAVILHMGSIAYAAQHLTDGVIPMGLLRRLTGASKEDQELLLKVGLWTDLGDGNAAIHDFLEHQRSSAEAKRASDKASRAAASRWAGEQEVPTSMPGSMPTSMPTSMLPSMLNASETVMPREREREKERQAPLSPPETSPQEKQKPPRTRGTRVPEGFALNDDMRAWAREHAPSVALDIAIEEFKDYWRGVPGAKGVKLDWVATWRTSMRKQQEWAKDKTPTGGSTWDRLAKGQNR